MSYSAIPIVGVCGGGGDLRVRGVWLGRACEKERTRGSAVFQAEHDSTQRTGTAPRSAVCLLPHYLGITNYSGAASACLTHSQSRV